MLRITLLAAAAATALLVPFASNPSAAQSPVAAAGAIGSRDHIRTTLYGTRGPVIVLVPGMSTPGAVWDGTVTALKHDHRLLVVEVKGFDGTPAAANETPGLIDGIISDIAADLDSRGIGQATIVGHSFGGLVAMKFALDHPRRAERVMVVDALPFFATVFDPSATVDGIRPRAEAMRAQLIGSREAMRVAAEKGVDRDPGGTMASTPEARIRIANWSMRADQAVVAQALYEDLQADLRRDIAAIGVPFAVLYQADPGGIARIRYETDYAAAPRAQLIPIPDTAHFIMLDQPERFYAQLRDFVAVADRPKGNNR